MAAARQILEKQAAELRKIEQSVNQETDSFPDGVGEGYMGVERRIAAGLAATVGRTSAIFQHSAANASRRSAIGVPLLEKLNRITVWLAGYLRK